VISGPANARLVNVFGANKNQDEAIEIAHSLFTVIEKHLNDRDWLVGNRPTLADISNYSYIAHAPEGGISLAAYPNIHNWLARIENLPGFVPMQATAVGLAA
jgi:glutathione S-transferase